MVLNRRRLIRACIFLMAALTITVVWFPLIQPAAAASGADIDISSKAVSKQAVKLSWSSNKTAVQKAVKWTIRKSEVNEGTGLAKGYSSAANLNKGAKKCTVKNLNANTHYRFEITGYVRKDGKLKVAYTAKEDNYTGIAAPKWDDHVSAADDGCSEVIRVVLQANQKGLKVKGYEIQRKNLSKKDAKFKKIAVVKDSERNKADNIVYQDKSVSKGTAYQYRARAYTGGKDKKWSGFSGTRTRYAIDKEGQFTIQQSSLTDDKMVLCVSSNKGNADLMLDPHDIYYGDKHDEDPIYVEAYSKNGKDWTKLVMLSPMQEAANVKQHEGKNYVILKGDHKIYLKFAPVQDDTDMKDLGRSFYSKDISYNGYSSRFDFSTKTLFGGKGKGVAKMK